MKFPESWLRDFVELPISGKALADALTMAGLESEELDAVAPPFNNVVVARVLSVARHPDADRLNVCQVDAGEGARRQIVCGAPNVVAGMVVPCALPDAVLPGEFRIKVAKVRGVESFGMLCSAKELGLADDASGLLMLPDTLRPGTNLRAALQLDDMIHVLKLTPNRGDCLSVLGIAREVAALTGGRFMAPQVVNVPVTSSASRPVILDAPESCPRYLGRIVTGVDARVATPDWMRLRLERAGLRSISALVDITNYVMIELGQPLHAFDNALLDGVIRARQARPGDRLLLLNGQTIELSEDVLVIADDAKVLAMAGIMGGEDSGITLGTGEVFLESAFFAPKAVAGRARRYGFGSDASHRFERGVDFEGARRALERATGLVLEICGGQAGAVIEGSAKLPARPTVSLRLSRLSKVLGVQFEAGDVLGLFKRLGLPGRLAGTGSDSTIVVIPPSYRFDIEIEEDLIEEVARIHGYNRIPSLPPKAALSMLPQTESARTRSAVRSGAVAAGYQEVVNFAFIEADWESDFSGNDRPIRLANPIASQMAVMRSSLVGGLVANLVANQRRKQAMVRLFEIGRCFHADPMASPVAGYRQPWRIAGLAWGSGRPEHWGSTTARVDFYDVKGDLEALMGDLNPLFAPNAHPALHPGRSAAVRVGGRDVGFVGEIHPKWVQKYELQSAPVVFEIDLDVLLSAGLPAYAEISNQPTVIRDLALVVDSSVALQTLLDAMVASRPTGVQDIRLFDVYVGKGVPEGKKSLAFRVVMQDTQKTLQDADVDLALQHWVAELGKSVGAALRA